jgi:hypothetical protein
MRVRARLDPLIPGLTDRTENLRPLLAELSRRGVKSIVASYLFLRPGFAQRVSRQLEFALGPACDLGAWSVQDFADGFGSGRTISIEERQARFNKLRDLAAGFGIDVHVCACKNPHLPASSDCKIAGPPSNAKPEPDTPLFR